MPTVDMMAAEPRTPKVLLHKTVVSDLHAEISHEVDPVRKAPVVPSWANPCPNIETLEAPVKGWLALSWKASIEGKSALKLLPALAIRPPAVTQSTAASVLTCELRHLSAVEVPQMLASAAVPAARDI